MPAAIHQINQRQSGRHHPAGDQQRGGCDAIDRSVYGGGKLFEFFLAEQAREKGKRGLPGRLSKNGDGNGEEAFGVVEARDVADAAGGEVAQNPVVGSDQRYAEHQRNREPYPLAEGGIVYIERGPVSGADFRGSDGIHQERADDAAEQRAIGQRRNTELMARHDAARDDEHVVDERAECREQRIDGARASTADTTPPT